jgi:hypothetical protein
LFETGRETATKRLNSRPLFNEKSKLRLSDGCSSLEAGNYSENLN